MRSELDVSEVLIGVQDDCVVGDGVCGYEAVEDGRGTHQPALPESLLDIESVFLVGVFPRRKQLFHVFPEFCVVLERSRGMAVLQDLGRARDDEVVRR